VEEVELLRDGFHDKCCRNILESTKPGGGEKMISNILFTINGCGKCEKARKHLVLSKINYSEVNILEKPKYLEKLLQHAGEIKIPAFLYGGRILTGNDIFTVA
jgi:glutaredoxin-related protein